MAGSVPRCVLYESRNAVGARACSHRTGTPACQSVRGNSTALFYKDAWPCIILLNLSSRKAVLTTYQYDGSGTE